MAPYKWNGMNPRIHPTVGLAYTDNGDDELNNLLSEVDNIFKEEGLGEGLRQKKKKNNKYHQETAARGRGGTEGGKESRSGGSRATSRASSSGKPPGSRRKRRERVKGLYNDGLSDEDEEDEGFGSEDEESDGSDEGREDDDDDDGDEVGFIVNKKVKQQMDEEKQRAVFTKLSETVKELMKGLKEAKEGEQAAQKGLRRMHAENKALTQKVQDMQKDQDQLEEILQEAIATGGGNAALRNFQGGQGYDQEERKKRLAAKKDLLQGVDNEDEDVIVAADILRVNFLQQLSKRVMRWLYRWLPLGPDIRSIQSQYGSSVASYFLFFRWLSGVYIVLAVPFTLWLLLHIFKLVGDGKITGETTGGVPWLMTYGSFSSSERYTYCCLVVFFVLVQLLATLVKWIKEDKIRQEINIIELEQKHIQFSKSFLCAWDNSLLQQTAVNDLRHALGLNVIVMLAELSNDAKLAQREMKETLQLWATRSLAMILYLALQLCAWSAIIYLTSQSQVLGSKLTEFLTSSMGWASLGDALASSIVPAAVSIINAIMPIVIVKITEKENWDSDKMVMYMLTGRMYFAKILNAFIQALSYMLLANPYLLASDVSIRENVEQGFLPDVFDCRIQQAAAGLFQLVLTEFVISKFIVVMIIYGEKLASAVTKKPYVKSEFEVARMMVSLLYFQALVLASFPLFPLGALPICALMYLSFKWDKLVLQMHRAKPRRPWKAQDAGAFFIKFYLATLVVFGAMNTYYTAIAGTFPKACELQDSVPGLCSSALADDNTCVMNSRSGSEWFSIECATTGYPGCVCSEDQLCGPFVQSMSMWDPMDNKIRQWDVFGTIYAICVDYNFVGWAFTILLYFVSYFAKNRLKVSQESATDRDRVWMVELQTAQAKLRKQTKRIETLELQANLANGEDDDDD